MTNSVNNDTDKKLDTIYQILMSIATTQKNMIDVEQRLIETVEKLAADEKDVLSVLDNGISVMKMQHKNINGLYELLDYFNQVCEMADNESNDYSPKYYS